MKIFFYNLLYNALSYIHKNVQNYGGNKIGMCGEKIKRLGVIVVLIFLKFKGHRKNLKLDKLFTRGELINCLL